MAYYGPNAEFLGNIKLTIWQYKAVSDAQLYKNIESLLIMFGIDFLSGIINGILLWKACKINVFKVMQKIQKEFWLIMGVQEAFFFVQVEIVIFYTLMKKVVLWCFFTSETSEKIHKSTFLIKISVLNIIFSNEMEK